MIRLRKNSKRGRPHPEIPGLFLWGKVRGETVWVTVEGMAARRAKALAHSRLPRIKLQSKQYQEANRERVRAMQLSWRIKNQNGERKRAREYIKKKRRSDPVFRVRCLVARRISLFLKSINIKKTNSTISMVGCSPVELRNHIQSLFKPGMHWGNHGIKMTQWQIDHKIPLASATTESQAIALCHYSNLQPLWGWENRAKSDKMEAA